MVNLVYNNSFWIRFYIRGIIMKNNKIKKEVLKESFNFLKEKYHKSYTSGGYENWLHYVPFDKLLPFIINLTLKKQQEEFLKFFDELELMVKYFVNNKVIKEPNKLERINNEWLNVLSKIQVKKKELKSLLGDKK